MYTSTKSLKALAFMATLAVGLLVFSLVNAGRADAWLHPGKETRHPSTGGTWEYGFWNAQVRSYYTVNKRHGSSVALNGSLQRSLCTAPGSRSIAEKYAINSPGATDRYYYRLC